MCGDIPRSPGDKFHYIIFNFLRGIAGYARMSQRYWQAGDLPEGGEATPGRQYLNQYLNQFLAQQIPRRIPAGPIDVLDIGCGSGYVSKLLSDAGYRGRYVGVDIKEHEDFGTYTGASNFESAFVESGIERFESGASFDLILSITAPEHIPDDAAVVAKCRSLLKEGGYQVHAVPTFWALFLYIAHYTPKRVKRLFGRSPYQAYRLGGSPSACTSTSPFRPRS